MKAAATTIWKRSAPVVLTGSSVDRSIDWGRFVSLPGFTDTPACNPSCMKAPITVCESALADVISQGERFPLLLSTASWLTRRRRARYAQNSVGFFALNRIPAGACQARLCSRARPAVYPAPVGAQVASPQSPILRWSTYNLNHPQTPSNTSNELTIQNANEMNKNGTPLDNTHNSED